MATAKLSEALAVKGVSADDCLLIERDGAVKRVQVDAVIDTTTADIFTQIVNDIKNAIGG